MHHFSWFHLHPVLKNLPDHVLTAGLVTVFIIVMSLVANAVAGDPKSALVPNAGVSLRGVFEIIVEFISGLVDQVMGHGHDSFIPIVGTMFLYILINNFMGLIPGFNPATNNLNTTLSCGLFVFVLYNVVGLKEHGLAYLKHFMGPLLWLAPLMLPIELVSHAVRPMSLGLRLYGNMTGDHTVLSLFLGLTPIGIPMIFYLLGMLVCFLQAFVFSLLSMVYISLASAHDH